MLSKGYVQIIMSTLLYFQLTWVNFDHCKFESVPLQAIARELDHKPMHDHFIRQSTEYDTFVTHTDDGR